MRVQSCLTRALVTAVNEIGEGVYATPAISAGSLFVRTETHLVRIGLPAN